MGMPLIVETVIVVNGNEKRMANTNTFELTLDDYRLFPMKEVLPVKNMTGTGIIGEAVVKQLLWVDDRTTIFYEMKNLKGVN